MLTGTGRFFKDSKGAALNRSAENLFAAVQDWIYNRTIFLTIHGSQSFGMATDTSDVDLQGVCIPPADIRDDLFHKFESAKSPGFFKGKFAHLANPKNPKIEGVVYSLKKYVSLATLVNPTILELLWVDPKFIVVHHPLWAMMRENRKLFLTRKARQTFLGYAEQQIAKIERHRKWLRLEKEPAQPTREQFGLKTPEVSRYFGEADRFIRRQVESWNWAQFQELDDEDRHDLKEACWDLTSHLVQAAHVDWENWPAAYYQAAIVKLQNAVQLPPDIMGLIAAEKRYQDALKEWKGYQNWKTERNPARRELERKYGYDCYSADTEFLTENGWKTFDCIQRTDRLATVSPRTFRVEYQRFTERYSGTFTGKLYHFTGTHTDILVTPNHNMFVRTREKNTRRVHDWGFTQAAHLPNCFEILRNVTPEIRPALRSAPLPFQLKGVKRHNHLRVLGWYISEGSVLAEKSRVKGISISQLKGGRVDQSIAHCLLENPAFKNLLHEYTHFRKSKQRFEKTWNIYNPELGRWFLVNCGRYSQEKRIPRFVFALSRREQLIVLEALMSGDGFSRPGDNSEIYYTCSSQLADDVQELAFRCGFETSKWGPYQGMYHVHINRTRRQTKVLARSKNIRRKVVHDYPIVCFTVPNHTLITRRKGKIAIQGNSKHGAHLVRLLREGLEALETGELRVLRPDAQELLSIRNGAWSYERVIDYAREMKGKLADAEKKSPLPGGVDKVKINDLYHFMMDRWNKDYESKV